LIAGVVLLAVAVGLWVIPSDQYILLPDRARPLAQLVHVKGERPDHDGGGIYYVAVEVKKASILEKLFHSIHKDATYVPAAAIKAPGQSDQQHQREEIRSMATSQEIGAAVALRALGYKVLVKSPGTVIAAVDPKGPSAGKIQANDLIVSVDGKPTPTLDRLRSTIRTHSPGDKIDLSVKHGEATHNVQVKTIPDPRDAKRPIIGVITSCALQTTTGINLPVPVRIDLGQVGGPSAGLAFALDIVEELGHDVDRGRKVVATGELCVDGSVEPIGGVKQKTIGAKEAGADIFLVPAGENADEARHYAGDMRIVPVKSFRQALRALATPAAAAADS
jgi:PDZ domain-containing protein